MMKLQDLVVNPNYVLCGIFYLAKSVLYKVDPNLCAVCIIYEIVKLRVFVNQVLHMDAFHRGTLA